MRTIERVVVSALLISKEGKIFQALRDPRTGSVYPSLWGIVGGGMAEGESQQETLAREVREETGIDISPYTATLINEAEGEAEKTLKETGEVVLCKMKFYTYKVVLDDKNADEVEVTLNDEHTEYQWTEPSELKNMKLTPPSTILFTDLGHI